LSWTTLNYYFKNAHKLSTNNNKWGGKPVAVPLSAKKQAACDARAAARAKAEKEAAIAKEKADRARAYAEAKARRQAEQAKRDAECRKALEKDVKSCKKEIECSKKLSKSKLKKCKKAAKESEKNMKSQAYYSAQEAWTDKEKQFEKCSAEARRKEAQCMKPPVSGAGRSHASAIIAGASVLVTTAALLF